MIEWASSNAPADCRRMSSALSANDCASGESPSLAASSLERAGVQGHQGQGMREGVVRFGCDGVGELLVGQVGLQGRGMRGGRAGHRIRRAQAGARTGYAGR